MPSTNPILTAPLPIHDHDLANREPIIISSKQAAQVYQKAEAINPTDYQAILDAKLNNTSPVNPEKFTRTLMTLGITVPVMCTQANGYTLHLTYEDACILKNLGFDFRGLQMLFNDYKYPEAPPVVAPYQPALFPAAPAPDPQPATTNADTSQPVAGSILYGHNDSKNWARERNRKAKQDTEAAKKRAEEAAEQKNNRSCVVM